MPVHDLVWQEEFVSDRIRLLSAGLVGSFKILGRKVEELDITISFDMRRLWCPEIVHSHFVVPGCPKVENGLWTVYRLFTNDTVLGAPDSAQIQVTAKEAAPDYTAYSALESLVMDYLVHHYEISKRSAKSALSTIEERCLPPYQTFS